MARAAPPTIDDQQVLRGGAAVAVAGAAAVGAVVVGAEGRHGQHGAFRPGTRGEGVVTAAPCDVCGAGGEMGVMGG